MTKDLLHRLNPFNRPSSAHSHHSKRPTSSLSGIVSAQQSIQEEPPLLDRTYTTPVPPASPKHQRTPSILRSLAHHPSLAALKNRSRKRRSKIRPSLPLGEVSTNGPQLDTGSLGRSNSLKKFRRGSLKGSRSIPSDMRLTGSGTTHYEQEEDIPPLPSPTPLQRSIIGASRRAQHVHTPDHHSTHASVYLTTTPAELQVVTPDSVRVRRMRFEIELESPRKRGMSTSAVETTSPPKTLRIPGSPHTRHLSTPASPSHPFMTSSTNSSPPRLLAPSTQQHPHPVPLARHLSPYGNNGSYFDDEFEPSTDYRHRRETSIDSDDGLSIMVPQEELPVGTPGGRTDDLRRGAFIDGAKHEKGAIRFFSRDMYSPEGLDSSFTSSPSSSDTHSPGHTKTPSTTSKIDKRASSPFEVKLTPMVTKRMSLDAFGASSPEISDFVGGQAEELVDEPTDDLTPAMDGGAEVLFHTTTLSTIDESPLSAQSAQQEGTEWSSETDSPSEQTRSHTPSSRPVLGAHGLPLPHRRPYVERKHSSAPPMGISQALLEAHADYTKALQREIKAGEDVVEELQAESRQLRDALEEESEEKRTLMIELNEKTRLLSKAQEDLVTSSEELSSSRRILAENEEFLTSLQIAHDFLATQVTSLAEENTRLSTAQKREAASLRAAHTVQFELGKELGTLRSQHQLVSRQLSDSKLANEQLRAKLAEADRRLESTADEYAQHLGLYDADLQRWRSRAIEHEDRTYDLQQELDQSEERQKSIETALKAANDANALLSQDLKDKEGTIVALEDELRRGDEEREEMRKNEGELRNSQERVAELEEANTALKDKLRTVTFGKDEESALAQRQIMELEERLAEMIADLQEKEDRFEEVQEGLRVLRGDQMMWEEERAELCDALERRSEDLSQLSDLQSKISSLENQLLSAQQEISSLQSETINTRHHLSQSSSTVHSQLSEIHSLRAIAEEAQETSLKTSRLHNRATVEISSLTQQLADLRNQLQDQQRFTRESITRAEMEHARAEDLGSRLSTYLSEVDRLTLSEASLRSEISQLKQESSGENMRMMELEKRCRKLEDDKELLNVALDSKQTELVLLQRSKGGNSTPQNSHSSHPSHTSHSSHPSHTSQSSYGPQTSQGSQGSTTRKIQHPYSSMSSIPTSTINQNQRQMETPVPVRGSTAVLGGRGSVTPKPLGQSTKHNQTPTGKTTKMKEHKVVKRSSLPVLVKKQSTVGMKKVSLVREQDGF
ncbi:hypothetical protein TREMEDRAFT_62726 [Tremella mesenterica DSM 1558]|uniref:uncharacterized protein n=1 Tax=Tremella mesenterica (strain ATCC 24925 / CBS 8224 / DSM 1558 / NBRC 9311 / NRRL Y-6157 / RJB 2259-6 / UBC 559-6) TaxID=578456 RepID=UPI0003F49739|nr:uncharacterized protein TREMEDRAFT_62726 [Tremella mesenterica DSM 1558]EIW69010.1 hypothetical protein TREMEDRAFT_62726 [Tremella mesenterica DSM 1558]